MPLIQTLIVIALVLVVVAIVIYAAMYAVRAMGLPEPYRTLILLALGLILLLVVLSYFWPRLAVAEAAPWTSTATSSTTLLTPTSARPWKG